MNFCSCILVWGELAGMCRFAKVLQETGQLESLFLSEGFWLQDAVMAANYIPTGMGRTPSRGLYQERRERKGGEGASRRVPSGSRKVTVHLPSTIWHCSSLWCMCCQTKVDGPYLVNFAVWYLVLLGFVRLKFLCIRKCIKKQGSIPKILELISNCFEFSKSSDSEP